MSNKDFYQETFSQVHGSKIIRWEDYQEMKHRKNLKRLTVLAAAAALMAALSGFAMAVNFFGLRDILLPEQQSVNVVDENGVVVPGEVEYKDFVSLSGYQNTPESQALAEWQAFLESYDRDGAILDQVGNNPTGFEDRYGLYLVYSQEMADKLEEIIAKYKLQLHSWMEVVLPPSWPAAVGGIFLAENNTAWSGYIYEDGTFRYDGEAELEGYGTIEYQFSRSVRGSFNDVTLNIGDLTDFQEWVYQTSSGTAVILGLGGRTRSLIAADLGDSFVLVNVLAGAEVDDTFSSGSIGKAELEALADSFDFTALDPAVGPDRDAVLEANDRYMETLHSQPMEVLPEDSEDPLYTRTGITMDEARDFLLLLAERLEGDRRQEIVELLVYPVCVETLDGSFTVSTPEELLEHYDETIAQDRLGLAAEMAWEPAPLEPSIFSDGSGLASVANGKVWFGLTEGDVIRIFTLQTNQWSIRPAEGIGQG